MVLLQDRVAKLDFRNTAPLCLVSESTAGFRKALPCEFASAQHRSAPVRSQQHRDAIWATRRTALPRAHYTAA